MVIMDGHGNLNDVTIKSVLLLTNIVILHFHVSDFDDDI